MNREPIAMVCCPDISGQCRGKGFPLSDLAARMKRGVGWVPTNIQITAFNSIADTPFGALGDLLLIPDPETETKVDFGDGSPLEHFFLGDIVNTDGSRWEGCLRGHLRAALAALKQATGLDLKSAFELEFQFLDEVPPRGPGFGPGFGLTGFRHKKRFGEVLFAALRQAGVRPDSYLREWGENQYEVTIHPEFGLRAADHGLKLRELCRATALRLDDAITFAPLRDPDGPGNGVHIHMSLVDDSGAPATYDPARPGGLSRLAGHFVAGILRHLPDMVALTAPSLVSYARLTPHRWSAVYNNLGDRDREASVRICPVADLPGLDPAAQFNFEFRAADSAASPHLQLAALVHAGVDGIRHEMAPPEPTAEDLTALSPEELTRRGLVHLPDSLPAALARLENSEAARAWFGDPFIDLYLKHKRGEMDFLAGKTLAESCRAYAQVY